MVNRTFLLDSQSILFGEKQKQIFSKIDTLVSQIPSLCGYSFVFIHRNHEYYRTSFDLER